MKEDSRWESLESRVMGQLSADFPWTGLCFRIYSAAKVFVFEQVGYKDIGGRGEGKAGGQGGRGGWDRWGGAQVVERGYQYPLRPSLKRSAVVGNINS